MNLDRYPLKTGEQFLSYEFTSIGTNGSIQKLIQFTRIGDENIFNLAFGDKNPTSGEIDDLSISNNGDSQKVLASVVSAIYSFFEIHPNSWLYATGSTDSRTRLYQIGINQNYQNIENVFELYGQVNDSWDVFAKNKNYQGFLVKKLLKFEI